MHFGCVDACDLARCDVSQDCKAARRDGCRDATQTSVSRVCMCTTGQPRRPRKGRATRSPGRARLTRMVPPGDACAASLPACGSLRCSSKGVSDLAAYLRQSLSYRSVRYCNRYLLESKPDKYEPRVAFTCCLFVRSLVNEDGKADVVNTTTTSWRRFLRLQPCKNSGKLFYTASPPVGGGGGV